MNTEVSRRQFTRECSLTGMALAFSTSTMAQPSSTSTQPIPIIDTHIHLFDPDRPQGAPYTGPPGVPTEAAFPKRYRSLAESLGVVGAIKVEASPWVEDNLWALQVAQTDDIMVGVVGNLQPEKPEFAEYLERYRKNRLFRGIRYGNLWDRDLKKQMSNPKFVEGLKLLAESDLVLDSANPNIGLLQGLVAANDKIPNLRIVIDHLPNLETTDKTAKILIDSLNLK